MGDIVLECRAAMSFLLGLISMLSPIPFGSDQFRSSLNQDYDLQESVGDLPAKGLRGLNFRGSQCQGIRKHSILSGLITREELSIDLQWVPKRQARMERNV